MAKSFFRMSGGVFALSMLSSTAMAQSVSLPGSADPNRVQERLQVTPQPQSKPVLELQSEDLSPIPAVAQAIRFQVEAITLDGVTAYPPGELDKVWQGLVGREVSLLDIYKLRDQLTVRYRSDGYVLSQVVIPAQKIENGVVRLEAVEGYITDVQFEGGIADAGEEFGAATASLKAMRPLRLPALERMLLLIDDLPGMSARSVFRPVKDQKGASSLVFVVEPRRFSASATVDNRGSEAIGPIQYDFSATTAWYYNQLAVRTLLAQPASELTLGDVSYTRALGLTGATVTAGWRRSWSSPGGTSKNLDIFSLTQTWRLAASYPIIRSRSETLRVFSEFNIRESKTDAFSGLPSSITLNADKIRTLSAGLSYDFADRYGGQNYIQTTFSQGLDLFGASRSNGMQLSRADGSPVFSKISWLIQRDQSLADLLGSGWSAQISHEGQLASRPLLASEEYGIGGKQFGLAYDPSTITGDTGMAAKAELQYLILTEGPFDLSLQAFTYADAGVIYNYGATPTKGWQSLYSTGLGMRAYFGSSLNASVVLAVPFKDTPGYNRDVRAFFTTTARF